MKLQAIDKTEIFERMPVSRALATMAIPWCIGQTDDPLLCLNIPILLVLNHFFGMTGIIWTQMTADIINVAISYVICARILRKLEPKR